MTRDAYLRSVGYWLGDLPWSTRRDLMAELRGHLEELPADTELTSSGLRRSTPPICGPQPDSSAAAGLWLSCEHVAHGT